MERVTLSKLIETLGEGRVAEAYFGGDTWLVVKSGGCIRYFNHGFILETIPLTFSNLNATYEIL